MPHTTQIAVARAWSSSAGPTPRRHRSCLVDADDGSERWSTSTWSGRSEATLGDGLVTAYGFVYVSTADGVVALDAATGAAPSPA
ncbi:hypothetical protein OG576_03180 [Streptomyces sp. NBC_01500]|nr:hypothetical protein [Streptomyces sp. NBC_01500]MCX4547876.1 hypothetical protein [Streptomyces sp. NBC_01500]